jgi:hypothetical protein
MSFRVCVESVDTSFSHFSGSWRVADAGWRKCNQREKKETRSTHAREMGKTAFNRNVSALVLKSMHATGMLSPPSHGKCYRPWQAHRVVVVFSSFFFVCLFVVLRRPKE